MSETTDAGDARTEMDAPNANKYAALHSFQRDLLHALAQRGPSKGLALKDHLEQYYDVEVSHSRLYPNLDELVEEGLVSKSARDQRTNEYALTDGGERALSARQTWVVGECDE